MNVSRSGGAGGSKEPIMSLYYVRALAILGVIMVHVTATPIGEIQGKQSSLYALFNFLNIFNKFGTPTFLFLSAFVLFYSYYDRPLSKALLSRFYKRRLMYILVPYLVGSCFYYMLGLYGVYGFSHMSDYGSVKQFLGLLVHGKTYYHLYFIFINAQFYVLFPFMLWLLQKKPQLTKMLIPIGLVLQWAFVIGNLEVMHYGDKGYLFISYFANFCLGAFFGIFHKQVRDMLDLTWEKLFTYRGGIWLVVWGVWLVATVAHIHLWYENRTGTANAGAFTYELLWFLQTYTSGLILYQLAGLLYRKLKGTAAKLLLHLGSVSFGVYIVHAAVLYLFIRLLDTPSQPHLYVLYYACAYAATLSVSWMVVGLLQKRFKFAWVLFGSVPKIRSIDSPGIRTSTAAAPVSSTFEA
ncbi:acyltransferase [Gorillibacterium massiliense]|uniref:acyltransferase n=1 Tax=Gorillibacterium massiliense TaxID=1280390 RepID=UPI000693BBE4|nr:acyltransferase [Gorillibacterium massiliense]